MQAAHRYWAGELLIGKTMQLSSWGSVASSDVSCQAKRTSAKEDGDETWVNSIIYLHGERQGQGNKKKSDLFQPSFESPYTVPLHVPQMFCETGTLRMSTKQAWIVTQPFSSIGKECM